MKKHLKFVLFVVAIGLMAVLIFHLKTKGSYDKEPALEKLVKMEVLGIHLPDIFLGVLGLAFVGLTTTYVASLVKGSGVQQATAAGVESGEGAAPQGEAPAKKLVLEKALGKKGSKILTAVVISLLIVVVLAVLVMVAFLLFPEKLPFLRDLFISR